MQNPVKNDEFKYCSHCGAANVPSAVECCECKKKIQSRYRPFYDFLKKHTKEELSGKTVETLFSYLYRFLLSHAYGIALSVTVVAAAASTVYAVKPHIEKVSETKVATVEAVPVQTEEAPEEEPKKEAQPLDKDDLYSFEHLTCNCDAFADNLRSSDRWWSDDVWYYNSVSEMYAENNIEGYAFSGAHDMNSNPIDMYMLDYDESYQDTYTGFWSDRYYVPSSAVTGEDCTTDFAKELLEAGYRVAECDYVLTEGVEDDTDVYDFDTHTGGITVKKLVYKFVFVEHDGKWYIAEDKLVTRQNV